MKNDFTAREFRKDEGKLTLPDVCTPIFDAEMGARLRVARMRKLWRQEDLGPRLGLNVNTLSRLEAGELPVPRHMFTVSKLEDVFGELITKYIILNRLPATVETQSVYTKFNEQKYSKRRARPKGEHWTHKQLREGKPVRGYSWQGIPGEIWDEARKIFNEREKKRTKKVK